MNIKEAKEFISTLNPKGLALLARRSNRKYPLKWTEHREGGGVIIDTAKIDYTGFSNKEVIEFAEWEKHTLEIFTIHKDKTLDMILSIFGKPKKK